MKTKTNLILAIVLTTIFSLAKVFAGENYCDGATMHSSAGINQLTFISELNEFKLDVVEEKSEGVKPPYDCQMSQRQINIKVDASIPEPVIKAGKRKWTVLVGDTDLLGTFLNEQKWNGRGVPPGVNCKDESSDIEAQKIVKTEFDYEKNKWTVYTVDKEGVSRTQEMAAEIMSLKLDVCMAIHPEGGAYLKQFRHWARLAANLDDLLAILPKTK